MAVTLPTLSAVQRAVFIACASHARSSFMPITPSIWWRTRDPFRGGRSAFAAHLRALANLGLLYRAPGREAAYALTRRGEALAVTLCPSPEGSGSAR